MATLLFVPALLSFLSIAHNVATLTRTDEQLGSASVTCQGMLEEIRALPPATVATLDGAGFDVPAPDGTPGYLQPLPGDPDDMVGLISVTVDQQTGAASLYRVNLQVSWNANGRPQTFQIETLITETL